MKWKSEAASLPNEGDKRRLSRFAWLPTKTDTGYVVWLEFYMVEEVYRIREEGFCTDEIEVVRGWQVDRIYHLEDYPC